MVSSVTYPQLPATLNLLLNAHGINTSASNSGIEIASRSQHHGRITPSDLDSQIACWSLPTPLDLQIGFTPGQKVIAQSIMQVSELKALLLGRTIIEEVEQELGLVEKFLYRLLGWKAAKRKIYTSLGKVTIRQGQHGEILFVQD